MNDHNLDDLIIDTPERKGGKAKGLLTIVALFIVVLIAAIVLTKIVLKDPQSDNALLVENETEIIDPELTLQNTTTQEESSSLSEMIEERTEKRTDLTVDEKPASTEEPVHKPVEEKTERLAEQEKPSKPALEIPVVAPEKPKPEPKKEVRTPKKREIVKIPQSVTPKRETSAPKPQPKPKTVSASKHKFYIQVGSFSKAPERNSQLMRTLDAQHYRHSVVKINGMYKVLIGPYGSRPEVDRAILHVRDRINKSAFVVKR